MENNEEVKLLFMLYLGDSNQENFVHRGIETKHKFKPLFSYDRVFSIKM